MQEQMASLARWRDAGLVTDEQVAAIVAYERERGAAELGSHTEMPSAPPAGSSAVAPIERRRAVSVEAIGYVGGALAVGAVALMLGEVWDELTAAARVSVLGLVTVLLGGAGLALRTAGQAPLRRLAGALLAAAVGGVAWTVATLAGDVAGWSEDASALVASVSALLAASFVYALARRALVQVALLAAVVATAMSVLAQSALTPDPVWFGLLLWSLGGAWLLLGRGGWLVPPRLAETLGGVLALVALQGASFGDTRALVLGLAVATAAALIALAVAVERLHHLVVGAIGLFVLVPQFVFELFGDAIGAPATLLVVGLLLVLLAVGLGRAHREVREEVRS